jgi:hypothetical protein
MYKTPQAGNFGLRQSTALAGEGTIWYDSLDLKFGPNRHGFEDDSGINVQGLDDVRAS